MEGQNSMVRGQKKSLGDMLEKFWHVLGSGKIVWRHAQKFLTWTVVVISDRKTCSKKFDMEQEEIYFNCACRNRVGDQEKHGGFQWATQVSMAAVGEHVETEKLKIFPMPWLEKEHVVRARKVSTIHAWKFWACLWVVNTSQSPCQIFLSMSSGG